VQGTGRARRVADTDRLIHLGHSTIVSQGVAGISGIKS
jgi:hypothetical protein